MVFGYATRAEDMLGGTVCIEILQAQWIFIRFHNDAPK
jgi:hypothetical protein